MNIGQAAAASGVSAKMIRYYEATGLIAAARRTEAGYRTYSGGSVETLRFVRRARDLGFSVEKIRELLSLWHDGSRPSRDVKELALSHVAGLNEKIAALQAVAETLQSLADRCCGDDRPECPILIDLASSERSAAAPPSDNFGARRGSATISPRSSA